MAWFYNHISPCFLGIGLLASGRCRSSPSAGYVTKFALFRRNLHLSAKRGLSQIRKTAFSNGLLYQSNFTQLCL
jgi:hypothetical protein